MIRKGRFKIKRILFFVLVMVTLAMPVYSLTASISNPKMVLYKNITKDEPLIFDNNVIVNNENDFDVEIEIVPKDDWKEIVEIKESEFTLKKGERKEVSYTITVDKAGLYRGDIIVAFKEIDSENKNALALAQTLAVHVEGEGPGDGKKSLDKITGFFVKGGDKTGGESVNEVRSGGEQIFTAKNMFVVLLIFVVLAILAYFIRRNK